MPIPSGITLKKLREITQSMLRIYPPLKEKIEGFETLVAHNFKDDDVEKLKENILNALEIMRAAGARELQEASGLQTFKNPQDLNRFRNLLGMIHLEMMQLTVLRKAIERFSSAPTKDLSDVINKLHKTLRDLLEKEERDLEAIEKDESK